MLLYSGLPRRLSTALCRCRTGPESCAFFQRGMVMRESRQDSIRAVEWTDAGVQLLDQRLLPLRHEYVVLEHAAGVAAALRDMVVRGAPAIGVTASYGE